MATKSVGIDIGSFSVKIAEVDAVGPGYVVSKYEEILLSPSPQTDRSLELIEILRNISASYDPVGVKFVLAIPQDDVSVRFKRFPFKDRQKILKSLAFELEDEIPLDLDEAVFDAKICEYVGDSADVLISATPKEFVSERLGRAKDGGIDPEILSVEGLALANLFERWNLPPSQMPVETQPSLIDGPTLAAGPNQDARLIVHMGHSRTLLLAYRSGSLVSVRTLIWGGNEIASAIARAFSLPQFEAVKVLQARSFVLMNSAGASREQLLMSNTITETVDHLIRDLKLSILDLSSEFNMRFANIDVMGGIAQIQNLAPYLTQSLEIPANLLYHSQGHRFAQPLDPKYEFTSALAVGLAIEGLKRPRNPPTNLRKGEFARQNLSFTLFWQKWQKAVQISAAAILIFFIYAFARDSITASLVERSEDALSKQATAIAGLKGTAGVEKYIKTQKTLIKNRQELAKLDNYSSAMDVLTRLTDSLPANQTVQNQKVVLDVQKLSIDNDELIIEGKVSQPNQVKVIEQALRNLAVGEIKAVTPAKRISGPGHPFAYRLKINRAS